MRSKLSSLLPSVFAPIREFIRWRLRILVQDRTSLHYLKKPGEWTANASEAMQFQHAVEAMQFCRRTQISNAQIVIRSGVGDPDLVLPVLV